MISEKNFVKIYDLNPFSFPKLRKGKRVPIKVKITFFIIQCLTLVWVFLIMFNIKVTNIESFVGKFDLLYWIIFIAINTWAFFLSDRMYTVCFNDVQEFDTTFGSPSPSQKDFMLLCILFGLYIEIIACIWVYPAKVFPFVANTAMDMSASYQITAIKHILSKRMKCIVDKVGEEENVLHLIRPIRLMMKYNEIVNQTYSLRFASGLSKSILILLSSVTAYWRVYGLHDAYDCYEFHTPVMTLLCQGHVLFELLFVGRSSTRFVNLVQSLSWEIDKKITMGQYPLDYRKQLEVLMLELTHRPVEFTGANLFTVNNSLVTDVYLFVLSCLMIFIQFMK